METIGQIIRRIRKAKGWTLGELSRESGIAASTLSDLEHGRQKRTTRPLQLSQALGITVNELEGRPANAKASYQLSDRELVFVEAFRRAHPAVRESVERALSIQEPPFEPEGRSPRQRRKVTKS